MSRIRATRLALLVGLVGSRAVAGDATAVVAALKDEASECRYLTKLCADAESAVKAWEARLDRELACAKEGYGAPGSPMGSGPCWGIGLEPDATAREIVANRAMSEASSGVRSRSGTTTASR